MSELLVYVDTSTVREGAIAELKGAIAELVEFIRSNVPRVLAYNVYLSEGDAQMTVVHLHADAASLDYHLETGGPAFRKFADLLTLSSIRVYGEPSESALRLMDEKARMLGCEDVAVHRLEGGFSRLGVD